MIQQKTNKGCKGHYWTDVQNIEDMKAAKYDMEAYYYEQNKCQGRNKTVKET